MVVSKCYSRSCSLMAYEKTTPDLGFSTLLIKDVVRDDVWFSTAKIGIIEEEQTTVNTCPMVFKFYCCKTIFNIVISRLFSK